MAVDGERAEEVASPAGSLRTASLSVGPDETSYEPAPVPSGSRRWPVPVVGAAIALAMVHVFVVGHYYFVGSFDDDANYILTAQALLNGQGLTGHLVSGASVVSAYPPGFPLLLVPLEWLRSHSFVPLQVFSATCFAAVFPLTWIYIKRRQMPDSVAVAVMALMALNPVMATFGAMVMAEMPYLACLMLLLLAIDRWESSRRFLPPSGIIAVVLGAEAVWLKEAGLGLVLGIGLWFVLRRHLGRAAAVVGGLALSLLPVAIARLATGVPLAGARYSSQLGAYYSGNLIDRLIDVLPGAAWHWLVVALPATVIPSGAPLPSTGVWSTIIAIVVVQASVLTIVGFVISVREYRDVAVVAVPAYVAETLLWPQVNERRVILALPVLLIWYTVGARWAVLAVVGAARRWPWSRVPVMASWSMLGIVVLLLPLVLQFPRDYLFGLYQDSSRPEGSRYMAILAAIHPDSTVVETDYRYTTALFSGHRTNETAIDDAVSGSTCTSANALDGVRADDAGFLLVGALNKPHVTDSSCLLRLATSEPWAVRLLRTERDEASVFELIGPGTAHPDLVDATAAAPTAASDGLGYVPVKRIGAADQSGDEPVTTAVDGTGTITWSFGGNRELTQVSVGEAGQLKGLADGVDLQIELPDGTWKTVASAAHAVGDGAHHAQFLLAGLPASTYASAVRVVVHGKGLVYALDVAALATGGNG